MFVHWHTARIRLPYTVYWMLGVSREAAMQTCYHSTLPDFVVMLFIAEYVPCAGDYTGNRFYLPIDLVLYYIKKRPRWSQLRGRWFPASLLMEMQYAFRFLPDWEHSEIETCPESTSKGTLCIFKLTVEKHLIYCGRGSKHNPCCTNSKAILVTIVKIAIIIATTMFCVLGMWSNYQTKPIYLRTMKCIFTGLKPG